MRNASVPARPVYRAAHTRARRRSRRRRHHWRNRLLALAACLLLMRGAAYATESALNVLLLDESAQQTTTSTPQSPAEMPDVSRPAPDDIQPSADSSQPVLDETPPDARTALDACLESLPGSVSVLAVRPSDGLTVAYNEDRQYYAASLLKAPYALWLCRRAEAGELDLDQPLGDWSSAREALTAMIARSDNQATTALYTRWPANERTGFSDFLAQIGVPPAHKPRALSTETKITGTLSAADSVKILEALDAYFATGTPLAEELKQAFLNAEHEYLVTDWPMAKKYGNWTGALHDIAIVYAPDLYYAAVLTDWGDPVEEAPECRDYYRELSARLTACMEQ